MNVGTAFSALVLKHIFQLMRQDPVHTIPLKEFVFQQLRQCHNIHGDKVFDDLTRLIDPDVYIQLQQFTKT